MGDEEGTTPWGQTSPAGTPLEEHGRFSRGAALAFRSSNLMLPFACHVNIPKLYIESSFFFTATDVRSLRVSIWGDTRCWISPRRCAFVVVCYIVVEGIFPREIVWLLVASWEFFSLPLHTNLCSIFLFDTILHRFFFRILKLFIIIYLLFIYYYEYYYLILFVV